MAVTTRWTGARGISTAARVLAAILPLLFAHMLDAQPGPASATIAEAPLIRGAELLSYAGQTNVSQVKIEGVALTQVAPGYWFIFDSNIAVRIHVPGSVSFKRGDKLAVTGTPMMRMGRPWLDPASATVTGRGEIPKPKRLNARDALINGGEDSQYVTVRGEVVGYGSYAEKGTTNSVVLISSTDNVFCKMILPPSLDVIRLYPSGTIAEFTGVCRHGSHVDGSPEGFNTVHVVVNGGEDVKIIWTKTASWTLIGSVTVVVFILVTLGLLKWRQIHLMRGSELRFRALIENSFDIIVVLNRDLTIKYASPSARRFVGPDWKAKPAVEVVHPDDRAMVAKLRGDILEAPGNTRRVPDCRLVAQDGTVVYAEGMVSNCLHLEGVEGIVVNVRDIDERKQAEEELRRVNTSLERRVAERTGELQKTNDRLHHEIAIREQAEENLRVSLKAEKELNQLKSSFVSMVSHEFRTPLEVILSSSDILDRYLDRLSPERRGTQLRAIRKSVHRMNDLIDDVLLLGKFDAGVLVCNPSSLDLTTFCRRAIAEVESATMREGAIQFNPDGLRGEATADEGLLLHILTNLLGNGIKYSRPGRPLDFTVSRRGTDAEFVIRNQGCGIPAANLPRLFTAFYRGSNVGQIAGSGLGLVITKRCVDLHGGKITCDSTEGVGTTFAVTLPIFDGTRFFRRPPKPMFQNS